MTSSTLEARCIYKINDDKRIEALRGVDLSIAAGEYMAVTGPSCKVCFRSAKLSKSIKLDTNRSRKVGFIFQAFHLTATPRAIENAQVPMLESKRKGLNCARRAYELLKEMGMHHGMDRYPNQLSADERQRAEMARAPVNEPEILLADTPAGNLDSIITGRTMETLTGIEKLRRITLIVMTHENEVAHGAAGQILIRGGKVES